MGFNRKEYQKHYQKRYAELHREERTAAIREARRKNPAPYRETNKKWRERNKEHRIGYRKKWRAKNLDRIKEYDRQKYLKDLAIQDSLAGRPRPDRCEHCDTIGKVVWDHSHETGLWRSWPCRKCNTVMGLVDDRPEVLRKLADTIERHREGHINQIQLQECPDAEVVQRE